MSAERVRQNVAEMPAETIPSVEPPAETHPHPPHKLLHFVGKESFHDSVHEHFGPKICPPFGPQFV